MNDRIAKELDQLEQADGFAPRVLYACESGSRAWGFASTDSDYDVRFIYILPVQAYLSVHEEEDTIDRPVDEALDLSGWELRKALRLFQRSNGSLIEWLSSPIVYLESAEVMAEWRRLIPEFFDPKAACGHYLGLAKKFWLGPLQAKEVTAKQYLYCLRALLAAQAILENGKPVPVPFDELRAGLAMDGDVSTVIDAMIERKAHETEKQPMTPDRVLHGYIESALPELQERATHLEPRRTDTKSLDNLFLAAMFSHAAAES